MTHHAEFRPRRICRQKKITRREKFLTRMETVILWAKLLAVIEPFYPKGERGRPPSAGSECCGESGNGMA